MAFAFFSNDISYECQFNGRTRTKSNLEDQKLKHIALYMALAIKGFSKKRNATTH
ncbi:hypothetical protein SLEP1_g9983 [Rubroshorea leprosula]|uniref:Uncharacterized protein n=1 Tax=Rubroshorea leprosula TaxID=152421 RepID=A0AAV5IHM1_9ROSI|nr:hypothetical protein SLEP1_g9983 [Rubroshorea leprosula]